MTAGMIKVPSIMPLRPPEIGRKNIITTTTPIELRTATPNTIIYYTINGMKPEPFKQIGTKCTYRYNKPFVLGPGKREVKSMATSHDGTRESSVVTKAFNVEESDSGDEMLQSYSSVGSLKKSSKTVLVDRNDGTRHTQGANRGMSGGQWNYHNTKSPTRMTSQNTMNSYAEGSNFRKPRTEPRFMNERFGSTKATIATSDLQSYNGMNDEYKPAKGPDNKTQLSKIQKDTDYLKCIFCFASRPSDPFARFCAECGSPLPPLPQTRLPPPEGGKLVTCVSCHSMVPINTPTCIICEAPMAPQWQPQASQRFLSKIVCVTCGTANPPDMSVCVTCEAKLPKDAKQIYTDSNAPPVPKGELGSFMTCSKCSRVNSSDARYCDWCGEKPQLYQTPIVCSKCEASNSPFARYCNSCGCTIEPPPRVTHKMKSSLIGMLVEKDSLDSMAGTGGSTATWLPVTTSRSFSEKVDKATSTVGLFYPSSQSLNSQSELEATDRSRIESTRDRRLLLAAVSPGRGYWRQQMDHICAHLKAHSQNNPDFRSVIGEPRLGKIITAAVHEDLNGEEVTLTTTFARRDDKEKWKEKSRAITNGLKVFSLSRTSSREELSGSQTSLQGTNRSTKGKKIKRKTKTKENGKDAKMKEVDRLLVKEVGPRGRGREEEIDRLLDEGADPNCTNADGVPVVVMATVNKHLDSIATLVNAGANVNSKTQSKGNTALHKAVSLGGDGVKYIDALLGLGAKADLKNDAGQSPYDIAMSSGHESIVQRFTSNMGNELLQKLTKPPRTKISMIDK